MAAETSIPSEWVSGPSKNNANNGNSCATKEQLNKWRGKLQNLRNYRDMR